MLPDRAGLITTVTLSPGFRLERFTPLRRSSNGAPISMLHSLRPASPGTMSWIQQCGLVHCSSFTVPASVTVLDLSNMAAEWCASAPVARSDAAPTTPGKVEAASNSRSFIDSSIEYFREESPPSGPQAVTDQANRRGANRPR